MTVTSPHSVDNDQRNDQRGNQGHLSTPAVRLPGNSAGRPSLRWLVRFSIRQLRRRPWWSLLVVALIASATVLAGVVIATVRAEGGDEYASANVDVVYHFDDGIDLAAIAGDSADDPVTDDLVTDDPANGASVGVEDENDRIPSSREIIEALPPNTDVVRVRSEYSSIEFATGSQQNAYVLIAESVQSPLGDLDEWELGRAPQPGEVAVGAGFAERNLLNVGDTLALSSPRGEWPIVGISRNHDLVLPGYPEDQLTDGSGDLWVRFDGNVSARQVRDINDSLPGFVVATVPMHSRLMDDPDIRLLSGTVDFTADWGSTPIEAGWLIAVIVFTMFAVVVGAVFALAGPRRLRAQGQLASNGAGRRALTLIGTVEGLLVGVGGFAVGLIGLRLLQAPIRRLMWHDYSTDLFNVGDLRWSDGAVMAVVGAGVGAVAGAIPALALSRIPVLQALAARRPTRSIPRWAAKAGVALSVVGLALTIMGTRRDVAWTDTGFFSTAFGLMMAILGTVLLVPSVVGLLGRIRSPQASVALRLAILTLGRGQLRASGAIAAIAVVTGVCTTVMSLGQHDLNAVADNAVIAQAEVLIIDTARLSNGPDASGTTEDAELPSDGSRLRREWVMDMPAEDQLDSYRRELDDLLDNAEVTPLQIAVIPSDSVGFTELASSADSSGNDPIDDGQMDDGLVGDGDLNDGPLIDGMVILGSASRYDGLDESGVSPRRTVLSATIATQGVLDARGLDVDMATIEKAEVLRVSGGDGSASSCPAAPTRLVLPDGTTRDVEERLNSEVSCEYGETFISPDAAEALGFDVVDVGWVLRQPDPLSNEQVDASWDIARQNQLETSIFQDAATSPGVDEPGVDEIGEFNYVYVDTPTITASFGVGPLVVAAGIVAVISLITVGLGLHETRRDRWVMVAVGMSPRAERLFAGIEGWALATIGTMLGVGVGIGLAVLTLRNDDWTRVEPDWPWLLAMVTLPPLIVAVATIGLDRAAQWVPSNRRVDGI